MVDVTTREQAIATLAAAIITASGRPWSIQQVLELKTDLYFAQYPDPSLGSYQAWAKTKGERLSKVHGAAG